MAKLITIPSTTLTIGTRVFGPFSISSTVTGFVATLDQVGWPHTGGRAFDWICEVSQDGGSTWALAASDGVDDLAIPAKFGNPANRINFAGDIPGAGNANRKIRLTLTVSKSVTVSGSFSAN